MPAQASAEPSEDYVAELLKQDARNLLSARSAPALSRRPDSNTRKPNLRFLNNIIRETDTHNSALKLRELEQAGDRLRRLRGDPPRERPDHRRNRDRDRERGSPSPARDRKRRRSASRSRSPSPSRDSRARDRDRRDRDRDRRHRRSRSPRRGYRGLTNSNSEEWRDCEERPGRVRDTARRRDRDDETGHARPGGERRQVESLDLLRRRVEDSVRDRSKLSSSSSSREATRDERSKQRRRRRSHDHERRRDRDREEEREREADEGRHTKRKGFSSSRTLDMKEEERSRHGACLNHEIRRPTSPSTSSRLSPAPPHPPPPQIIRRGRGAHTTSASAMDARFLSTYDPKVDIQPASTEADGDDWDYALEAARDRAAWKKTQADRLRTAGFTPQQVETWEKGEAGKKEEDVVWRAKGQGRDWDVGKVVGEDGNVETRAAWAK